MINKNFFHKKHEFITLGKALEITGSKLADGTDYDLNKKIHNVATLDNAGSDDISFFHSSAYAQAFLSSKAGFCFINEKDLHKAPSTMIALINPSPYFAYGKFLGEFYLAENHQEDVKISSHSHISKTAHIGKGAVIKAGAVIGENVKIGDNCFVGENAVIKDGCVLGNNVTINTLAVVSFAIIGNNVTIFNGAKIGQDGFGFAHENGKLQKILQLGIVEIHDDVEIGAGTCIDRGAINNTIIGKQVKIDNLVQIGHNVIIGEGTVIAGCSAVAGSTKIGRFVQIGGKSSISGHLTIGDGAKIAGMSGVAQDISPMQSVGGIPAMPIRDWHRMNIKLMQMLK